MGLTPEAEEAQDRSMRKEQEERERQAKQRKNNEQLAEMLAQKLQTPPQHQCKDSRVPALERRIAELERLFSASSQVGANVNTVDMEQEEKPVRSLNLKTQTWYGNKINFDVAAKPILRDLTSSPSALQIVDYPRKASSSQKGTTMKTGYGFSAMLASSLVRK